MVKKPSDVKKNREPISPVSLLQKKYRNVLCFDKFSRIDDVLKSNDGRFTKGSGSMESEK